MEDIYQKLANHLQDLVMGYPVSEALFELLKETFTPIEARVALSIPNDLLPLEVVESQTIVRRSGMDATTVEQTLEGLASRGLLYSAPVEDGRKEQGYALLQVGYGMPQTYFWSGQGGSRAKKMARHVLNYFTVANTHKIYGGVRTKTYKYSPANASIDVTLQGVMPNEQIVSIVQAADRIAVAHCPCRMSARLLGRTDCTHSLEVCIKYDEMAQFVVDRNLARAISADEAISILSRCEEEGLVHMVDNAQGQVKHTCNCCGHYCWNVGIIKRRKVPRDALMAVYFVRRTDSDACIGCGACVDICPVAAVELSEEKAAVDDAWCIGCGVCAAPCPTGAVSIHRRTDAVSPENVADLHRLIRQERKGRQPGPS